MGLSLVSAPTFGPLSLAEAKAQLRMEDDASQDTLINGLCRAALELVQNETHRALPTQTWDLVRPAFPCGVLELPLPPVQSITSISYIDPTGATQTFTDYVADLPAGPKAGPGRIAPSYGYSWPATRDQINAVRVRFVAGYGKAIDVPAPLMEAQRLLVTYWFDNRLPAGAQLPVELRAALDQLIWPYKAFVSPEAVH